MKGVFEKFAQRADEQKKEVLATLPTAEMIKSSVQREKEEQKAKATNYKQKLREMQQRNDEQNPRTLVFTNCGPSMTQEQLTVLVSHKLDIPVVIEKKSGLLLLDKDGAFHEIAARPESELQIEACYFRADNYTYYDKESHQHKEMPGDFYKTKVGFVVFNREVTEEMVLKTKVLETKERTLFSAHTLQDPINRQCALYVVNIRAATNLQKLIAFVQKACQTYQPTNRVTNIKTFYEGQRILGYMYLELQEEPNEVFARKMFNKTIECPNEIKILKSLGEKKAKKHAAKVQQIKAYKQSVERKLAKKQNLKKQ